MARSSVPRSKRQYVQRFNIPALRIVRDLPGVKDVPIPSYVEPCLATLAGRPPAGERWVHEIKFDGYRLQLHIADGKISCFTRRGYDWARRFPTIVAAAARLELDAAILDGEAVVVTEKGDTDFSALESYVSSQQPERSKHPVVFYAFDLLYLRSLDLGGAPLIDRKRALAELLAGGKKNSPLRYSEHLEADGMTVFRNACGMELEGVVSTRVDRHPIIPAATAIGSRSPAAIATRSMSPASRKSAASSTASISASAGGRGWSTPARWSTASPTPKPAISRRSPRASPRRGSRSPPIGHSPRRNGSMPRLRAEVEYRRKTKSGLLRHPSYKGLREDLD
jgi:bifunctional non-homologous end joining protein LigD